MFASAILLLAALLPANRLWPPPPAPALLHSPHDVIDAWALSPDFEHDRTLFVSLPRFNLLLRSRDGGESFEPACAGLDTSFVRCLAISPGFAADRTLWCASVRGLYVTRDAGETWRLMDGPPALREVVALAVSPDWAKDGTLLAGTGRDGLLVSRDRGASWSPAHGPAAAPLAPGPVGPLAFSPAHARDGALAAVRGARLLLSTDRGQSFTERAGPGGTLQALVLDEEFGASGTLWVGTREGGVWRSDDRGEHWRREGEETAAMNVLHLARARGPDGGLLLASTAAHGVQVKPDGESWRSNPAGFREPTHQTLLHYTGTMPSPAFARDRTVFAATFEGLYVSRTGGDGWQWINVLHPHISRNIALSRGFAADQTLWVSSYGAGLLESGDGGRTFRPLDTQGWMFPDGIAVSPDYARDRTLLVGTPNKLLISTDGGQSTRPALPGGRGFPRCLAFAPDWAQSGVAFAYFSAENAARNRLVRTADRGATWAECSVRTVYDLAFAPDWTDSGRVYVGGPDGLQRSEDGGLSFQRLPGLEAPGITSIAAAAGGDVGGEGDGEDGAGADILMACSPSAGVHLSRDGGESWTALALADTPGRPGWVRLSPDFARDGTAFAGPVNDTLHVTRDAGSTWTRVKDGPRIVMALEVSPTFETDRTLLVGSYDGPWISRDAGASWSRLRFPVPDEPAMSHEVPPPPAPQESGAEPGPPR